MKTSREECKLCEVTTPRTFLTVIKEEKNKENNRVVDNKYKPVQITLYVPGKNLSMNR